MRRGNNTLTHGGLLLPRGWYSKELGTTRRGGRAAEGARLESVYTGNRIGGSNPPLSATQTSRFGLIALEQVV